MSNGRGGEEGLLGRGGGGARGWRTLTGGWGGGVQECDLAQTQQQQLQRGGKEKWDKADGIKGQEDVAVTDFRLAELYYICQSTDSDERNVLTEHVAAGFKWYKSE